MVADGEHGATSVVGVILLVAVTVVAAGTVGAFAMRMDSNIGTSAAATFDLEQNRIVSSAESDATVDITYEAGNLERARGDPVVVVNGTPVGLVDGVEFQDSAFSDLSSGETATLVQTAGDGLVGGDTVQVRFREEDSSMAFESTTLQGTDIGSFSFGYTSCYRCASEAGDVVVTYNGDEVPWDGIEVQSQGTIRNSPGPTLTDGESFKIWDRTSQVDGTVQIYFTDASGNRVLVAEYETP